MALLSEWSLNCKVISETVWEKRKLGKAVNKEVQEKWLKAK